ncbi:MAG: alpha/beta hydrolase [Desulfobacterales bacterium]
MPFVASGKEKLFYSLSRAAAAPLTLVCLHGSGGRHTHWPEGLRASRRVRTAAVDLPGHGRSSGAGRSRVEDYADDIAGMIQALGLASVALMGHSLGGAIVQVLALRRPAWLKKIVLVGTGARLRVAPAILEKLLQEPSRAADLLGDWSLGPTASPALRTAVCEGFRQTPPEVTHGDFSACDRFDIMAHLSEIGLPALVVSGAEDRLTPPKYGDFLARHMSDARHVILPRAGHMLALEFPAEFTRLVEGFLADVENG